MPRTSKTLKSFSEIRDQREEAIAAPAVPRSGWRPCRPIVLAAGNSRRMGRQKLLLPMGEGTVVGRIVDELLASPVDQVLVVVGSDGGAVAEALEPRPVQLVVNPDPDGDMLSSVRCGLRAMDRDQGVLVVPGDLAGITRVVIAQLVAAFADGTDRIVVPTFEGKRGHPLLFSAAYRQEILTRFDNIGLRGLLEAHPDAICQVEVDSPAVLVNMNLPEDYRRVLEDLKPQTEITP
ncbi:MAG: nucleotidyltransferase family protein [Thermoguttaceae bacterium]